MDRRHLEAKVVYLERLRWDSENTNSGRLHVAIGSNDIDTVRQLIQRDPRLVNGSSNTRASQTPIFTAVFNNHVEILNLLLESGASSNIRDAQGFAVLNIAAVERRIECIRTLLRHGADVNIETPDKADHHFTPLHTLATSIRNHGCDDAARACVQLLLENGADRTLKFGNGQTAEEIAPVIREIAEQSANMTPRP